MMKLSGIDNLQRTLQDAEKALEALDGDLGTVSFDPHNPASIEAAIQEVGRIVDDRVSAYSTNSIVGPMAESLKEKYREAILEKAAAARLGGGTSDG